MPVYAVALACRRRGANRTHYSGAFNDIQAAAVGLISWSDWVIIVAARLPFAAALDALWRARYVLCRQSN